MHQQITYNFQVIYHTSGFDELKNNEVEDEEYPQTDIVYMWK